jgi:Tol biopolymer transport system component
MRKRLLKILLLTSIVSIGISSCQKEYNERNGSNAPGSNARGPKGPKTNRPPVANAGLDQPITLPTNSVNLNGSATDPDNNIISYQWTKISGPSSFTIATPNSAQTQVTNLVEGAYQFELKVTDQFGLNDKDTVQVRVWDSSPPSLPPCTTCKIVFVSDRDGNSEIYTSNTDGSNITRLTNNPGNDDDPVWSPDGTRIAFTSNRDGSSGIYIMNADGSNVVRKTFSVHPDGGILGLTWSPDGTKIAYSDYASYNDYYGLYEGADIYTVSATSGSPLLLFQGADVGWPDWSPDGTKIALVAQFPTPFEGFTDYHIYTINSDGTGFTALTSGDDLFTCPSWSPNGAKLAVAYNFSQVGVMNSDGGGLSLLRSGSGGTSWSADGTIIVYTSSSGSMNNVSWVAADGSAGGTIVTNSWNADWKH